MVSDRMQRQIDRLLDEIDDGVIQREWDKVLELCDDVLALDPDNADALGYRTAAERRLGTVASQPQSAADSSPQS